MEQVYPIREGGDIFASDMVDHEEVEGDIAKMFADSTIFITGSTGYLGKMFLEKLLRACPNLKKIYLLIRPKKGKDMQQRFQEIFDGPNMEPLKRLNPKYHEQVAIVHGDCQLPDIGLDDDDRRKIIEETNYVIHCAATVRFDEKIRTAAHINVRAVRDMIVMARQMKNLKAFLHVSTAFSNCPQKTIDELYYEPPMDPHKIIELVDMMSDEKLAKITPGLIDPWPNTYVFTKAIAEDLIKNEAKDLPLAILRPSIVIGSKQEPVAGWIDNFYGATGIFLGAAVGLIRSINGNKSNMAELIPSDYVINNGLAAMWEIVSDRSGDNLEDQVPAIKEPPIYNSVGSVEAPITWAQFMKQLEYHTPKVPSELQVWRYCFDMRPNYYHHMIMSFLLHTVPAYIVDFLLKCFGKEPMLVKGYKKIEKFSGVLSYFTNREWVFKNANTQRLWKKMNDADRRLFEFSMKDFNWDSYFVFYSRGCRVYLLKDPLETIPKGVIKNYKLMVMHYSLIAVLLFLFYKIAMFALRCLGLF